MTLRTAPGQEHIAAVAQGMLAALKYTGQALPVEAGRLLAVAGAAARGAI